MPGELSLEIQAPGMDSIKLVNEQIVSFVYHESISGCAAYDITLATKSYSGFDTLIKQDGMAGYTFKFRYGFRNDRPQPVSENILSDWKTLELLEGIKRPLTENMIYSFRGLCHGHVLNRSIPEINSYGNSTISEIVSAVAGQVGLRSDVKNTTGILKLTSGDMRCSKFLNVLRDNAYSQTGNDWRFWIRNGDTLVFKPVDVQRAADVILTDNAYAHSLNYLQLIKPKLIKSVAKQHLEDTGKIKIRYNDPLRVQVGRPFTGDITIDDNNSGFNKLSAGNLLPRQYPSRVIMTGKSKDRNTEDQTRLVAYREGVSRFSRNARNVYRLVSYVPYTAGLTVGSLVNVLIQQTEGMTDLNSGPWLLHTIRSMSTKGVLKSMVVLEKRWEK